MVIINASADAFLLTAAAILIPSIYHLRRQYRKSASDPPHRISLHFVLLMHTLYIMFVLFLRWPPNIFKSFHMPLTIAPDAMRRTVLERAGLDAHGPLPKPLDNLITRLSSFEMRTLYVRFGQIVVQDCEHCRTFDDYAVYALPHALFAYIREAAVLGLLTIVGSGRERWRTYVVGALAVTAVLECYWISTVTVRIPKDGRNVFMWHDNLWILRQLVFLLLSIVTHLLPSTSPLVDPASHALATHSALEQSVVRLATLRYARSAVMRQPLLRAAASEWWDRQRLEGEWARSDEAVQRVAEQLGRGFVEGQGEGTLRVKAKETAARIKASLLAQPAS